jgi:beta-glucosidase
MEEWKDCVPAILMAWYPGMEGGHALARVLFGERRMDHSGREPAFPFGFGLSYTRFEYEAPELSQSEIDSDGSLSVRVRVKNVGDRPGEEVVQLYVGFENSAVEQPRKLLRDFQKIFLKPGEEDTASLSVHARDLAWFDPQEQRWVVEAMTYTVYVGSSSRLQDLRRGHFEVR